MNERDGLKAVLNWLVLLEQMTRTLFLLTAFTYADSFPPVLQEKYCTALLQLNKSCCWGIGFLITQVWSLGFFFPFGIFCSHPTFLNNVIVSMRHCENHISDWLKLKKESEREMDPVLWCRHCGKDSVRGSPSDCSAIHGGLNLTSYK